ncbi:MAG: NAD(P)-dependent alcohol dehydrogenase [Porticoccaceae bacterium]|nr:NAD(P)-dependent alcohol dehydrogenase [Pseudomonadales bacterium]MCP5172248.1 NAD(P)-dependent alcohol dehydrogenase [Pseudomonadales bacterium]
MNNIKAAIARGPGQEFSVEEVQLDDPRENEVLVKISGVGICHSDLAAKEQHLPFPMPAVLGHEGSGIVEKVGSGVTHVAPGDHVVLSFVSCGHCGACNNDLPSYCQEGFVPQNLAGMREDGSKAYHQNGEDLASHFFGQSSFGTYALASASNTVKVRNDAPIEMLGPLGCGIQTGAGSIIKAMACEPGSSLVVAGGGGVGLSAVMGGVVQQCSTIIVVEPQEARRELALSLGATHVIDPLNTENLTEAIRAIKPEGVNYGFDTSARQDVIEGITLSLAPAGTLGLVGIPGPDQPNVSFNVMYMLSMGITVMGITEGNANPSKFIPEMVDMFMEGRFPFDKLCKTYTLDQINEAVVDSHTGKCVKAVLIP